MKVVSKSQKLIFEESLNPLQKRAFRLIGPFDFDLALTHVPHLFDRQNVELKSLVD